jgi:hypothetical protein
MTNSRGLARPRAADSTLPALPPADRLGSSLVGWLIQTAFICVVEGTCETFYESRGSNQGVQPGSTSRFAFPLNFYQNTLISKIWSRESRFSTTGRVAGQRRRRRAVPR